MKKIILIIVAVLIVAGGAGYYWWLGTPLHSLMELKGAIANHDTTKALTYFDTDSIFNGLWAEGMSTIETQVTTQVATNPKLSRFANRLPALEQQATTVAKPIAEQKFVQILTESLANPKPKDSTASSTDINSALNEKPSIKTEGDTCTITTPKGITLIMKKQSDRSWKITEIKGIFEAAMQKRG